MMWLTLLIKNWKYAVMAGLLIVMAGMYLTIKIQDIALDRKEQEISACKATYQSQKDAIGNLQKDIASANKSCSKRLNSKDALIKRLQEIDEINIGGSNVQGDSSDSLLHELNRLFNNR